MSDHATVNINASMTQAIGAINNNYQSVVGVVATLMALSAAQSQQQAQLGTLFSTIEHMTNDQFKAQYPNGAPNGWTNAIYKLNNIDPKDSNASTEATQDSSTFSSDQGTYNSVNQSYSGFISQINQMTSQNTQAEGQTTQIGTNIANFENGVSRLLTY
jgi:hypothetical protein